MYLISFGHLGELVVNQPILDMSTFHPFPKLPLELRLAIWEMTVEAREVEVRIMMPTSKDPRFVRWPHPRQWGYIEQEMFTEAMPELPNSTRAERRARKKARDEWKPYNPFVHMVSSTVPATLQTCREARNHGLYQQVSLGVDEQHPMDRRYAWLNLDIDMVNIGTLFLNHFLPIASSIKRLKLGRRYGDEWWSVFEKDLLRSFVNVEEVHVVCIDGFWNWGDGPDVFPWPCPIENVVFIEKHWTKGYLVGDYREVERIQMEMVEGSMGA
ncbi:hypothetical protein J1614_006770 [Plenodomus biglobosus]|nr:hypothetical protein J1614_006770 [Plenodomus biglobosus]